MERRNFGKPRGEKNRDGRPSRNQTKSRQERPSRGSSYGEGNERTRERNSKSYPSRRTSSAFRTGGIEKRESHDPFSKNRFEKREGFSRVRGENQNTSSRSWEPRSENRTRTYNKDEGSGRGRDSFSQHRDHKFRKEGQVNSSEERRPSNLRRGSFSDRKPFRDSRSQDSNQEGGNRERREQSSFGRGSFSDRKPFRDSRQGSRNHDSNQEGGNRERREQSSFSRGSFSDRKPFRDSRQGSRDHDSNQEGANRERRGQSSFSRGSFSDRKPFRDSSQGSRNHDSNLEGGNRERRESSSFSRGSFSDRKPFRGSRQGSRNHDSNQDGGNRERREPSTFSRGSFSDRKPFKDSSQGSRNRESYQEGGNRERRESSSFSRGSFSDRKPFRDSRQDARNSDRSAEEYNQGSRGRSFTGEGNSQPEHERKFHTDRNEGRGRRENAQSSFGTRGQERNTSRYENDNQFRKSSFGDRNETYSGQERSNSFSRTSHTDRPWSEKRAPSARVKKNDGLTRLNKYIANAGICSRREADVLIGTGVVSVNGNIITEMGFKVSSKDIVHYGGERLVSEKKQYVLLNKPKGFITTVEDPEERKTVMSLIENACKERLYPVGRLDRNTTGLLLFTNDGELTKKLTHPSFGARKLYHVELNKALTKNDLNKILEGIQLEDGPVHVDKAEYVENENKKEIGIEIHSGKNRIVRRIFESLGYDVVKLDRVMFAGLSKKELTRGHWRHLSDQEIQFLRMIG